MGGYLVTSSSYPLDHTGNQDFTRILRARQIFSPYVPDKFLAIGNDPNRAARRWENRGSNAWAVGPGNSESGHALLLANPHLPWSGFFLFIEAQLNGPDLNVYGVTLVGMPTPIIAFNDHLGWTHTVNINDGCDLYELTLDQDGYLLDGQKKDFQKETQTLKVKASDGTLREQELVIENSVFGPVAAKKEKRPWL